MRGIAVPSELLDVHHVDGNRKHNKIENLEVLCVWCHAIVTRGLVIDIGTLGSLATPPDLGSGELTGSNPVVPTLGL